MNVKNIMAASISGIALATAGVIVANASTYTIGNDNRTWTYGKQTSSTAVSNLMDFVATHDSSVYNETTGAYGLSLEAGVHNWSYGKVSATSSNVMDYNSSAQSYLGHPYGITGTTK